MSNKNIKELTCSKCSRKFKKEICATHEHEECALHKEILCDSCSSVKACDNN